MRIGRVILRITLAITCTCVLLAGGWIGWQRVRDRVLVPRAGSLLREYVEQHHGWRLTYQSISSDLFSHLSLRDVRLELPLKEATLSLPPIALAIDHLRARFSPWSLRHRQIDRLNLQGARLLVGKTTIALEVAHSGDRLDIVCPSQSFPVERLVGRYAAPYDVVAEGPLELEGRWSFIGHHSDRFRLSIRGTNLPIRWRSELDARAHLALLISGSGTLPMLQGAVDVTEATWSGTGVHPVGTALGKDEPALFQWADRFPGSIQLDLTGAGLDVRTDHLQAKLTAALKLQKILDQPTRLVGTLRTSNGTYTVKRRTFRIESATIRFAERMKTSPKLHAVLNTRVKRYRIRVAVSGTLADSQLSISSRPELPHDDILALLIFGHRISSLAPEQRQALSERDEATQTLDFLLLGRAELLAARWLGLDEINVNLAPKATTPTQPAGSPIESVEVGKYVIPDRVFGTYKLQPPQTPLESPRHTVGAALQLTDRLSVEGSVTATVQGAQQPALDTSQTSQPLPEPSGPRRVQAEEALIRFRWKF